MPHVVEHRFVWLSKVWCLACALLLGVQGAAWAQAAAMRDGLPAEQREIVVGLLADYTPFERWPTGATQAVGYDVDLLKAIAQRQGWRLRFQRFDNFDLLQQALRQGEVDVLTSMAQTLARSKEMAFTRPYAVVQQLLVGRDDMFSASSNPDLAGRSLGVIKGFASAEIAAERFSQATKKEFATLDDAVLALQEGKIDLLFQAQPALQRYLGAGSKLRALRTFSMPTGRLRLATRLSDQPLAEQLDAAIGALDQQQHTQLHTKWLELPPVPEPELPSNAAPEPALRVGFFASDPTNQPNEQGQPEGLGIDLLEAVLARAQLKVASYRSVGLAESLDLLKKGELDLVLSLSELAERREHVTFVGPYHGSLLAIVSRRGFGVTSLDQLSERKMGIVKRFYAREYIARLRPDVELVECENSEACLEMLEKGEVEATVYQLFGLQERLFKRGTNLQISGFMPDLADEDNFGLSKQAAHLAPRLRAALDHVLANDLPAIEKAQALKQAQKGLSWRDLMPWLIGALLVAALIALAVWWHVSRLKLQARKKHEARERAEAYLTFMTHEVRNALQAVVGATVLMGEDDIDADPGQRRHLRRLMRRSARSTMALMDTLLDRHRGLQGQLDLRAEPVDLGRLVQMLVEDLRPAADAKKLRLIANVPDGDTAFVLADATRVQQVLRNLVINAIKFTNTGEILVRLSVARLDNDARHDRMVDLLVRDQGAGMNDEQMRQLFKVSRSQGGDRPGSGLGLMLCRELAELMEGSIRVESQPGQGSSFHFRFATSWASPPDTNPSPQDARVLVVEPAAEYGELLRVAFGRAGLSAVQVSDAQGAIDAMRSGPGYYMVLCARSVLQQVSLASLQTLATEQLTTTGQWPSLVILESQADEPKPTHPQVAGSCLRSGDVDELVSKALRLAQRHQQVEPPKPSPDFGESSQLPL